jgi:hypothetical protein
MRVRISRCIPAVAALIACSTILTGCNSDADSSANSTPEAAPSASAEAHDSASASPEEQAPGTGEAAAGTAVPVDKTIVDDVMGQKATVIEYVRDFQPSAAARAKFSALENQQVVLVHVKVTAGSKYYTSFGAGSFRLTGMPNGIDQSSTTILDDEVEAAGYPPLQDAKTGKTATGWIVFTPTKDADKLVLRYKRLAAQGSDGTAISAKNFDVPLN